MSAEPTASAQVRVGTMLPQPLPDQPGHDRLRMVEAVAQHGLDHIMVGDHVSFWAGLGADGLIGAAATLGARPDLAVYVGLYLLPLRHPVPVARQVADIAALAPGRLTLGVGIGGEDRHEVEVCGVDPATRGQRMDECLTVLRELLAGRAVTFDGRHVQLHDALVLPPPDPAVPLVVGGRSDAAMRRAATLGDGWLGIWVSAARYATVAGHIGEMAAAAGRDEPAWQHGLNVWCGLDRSHERARAPLATAMQSMYQLPYERFERWSPYGTPADVAEFLVPYVEAGCGAFNLIPCGVDPDETVAAAAEVRRLILEAAAGTSAA